MRQRGKDGRKGGRDGGGRVVGRDEEREGG